MNSDSSPKKRRGSKTWNRGRKKGDTALVDLPLVAQGIPHLSISFIQKNKAKNKLTTSKGTEEYSSLQLSSSNALAGDSLMSNLSEGTQSANEPEMALKMESKEGEKIALGKNVRKQIGCDNAKRRIDPKARIANTDDLVADEEPRITAPSDHMDITESEGAEFETALDNSFCEEVLLNELDVEDKPDEEEVNNFASENVDEVEEEIKVENPSLDMDLNSTETPELGSLKKSLESESNKVKGTANEKEPPKKPSKVEFISVYSAEEPRKKPHESSKVSKDQEQRKEPSILIGPLQPVLELVDPVQLDKETEKYYKEVGAIPQVPQPSKPKCLTPGQIAKITREYALDKDKSENSEKVQTAWNLLHQYWTFVQENPYDFDGWTYLLNHVDTMDNIEAARSAYEGFLPLYPYCFAYWMKLSDLELKFSSLDQALGVLHLGTKCVPFCTDLWVPLLNKFLEYAKKENISEEVIRGLYEFTLDSLGMSWQSSSIWDVCINYELTKGDLVRVMNLYRRVLSIPTKLYNKHWDHLLALVRDYHPRNLLTIEEYSNLKKSACDLLKIKFNPPSLEAPKTLLKVTQPEDKIHTTIKEKIVAALIPIHEANEKECNRRWKYEEKIKRPYFHVKPLEKKQLKTWREYIDFEVKESDPVRIVTLFERCLVPCAMYEEFWCKYASYMEDHVLNVMKNKYSTVDYKTGCFTVKKDKGSDEAGEGNGSKVAMVNGEKKEGKTGDVKDEQKCDGENAEIGADFWQASTKSLEVSPEVKFEVTFLLNRLSEEIGVGGRVLTPPSLTPSDILRGLSWEDVRQIYRRGAWIHCPSKPLILMQWAEFEEAQENIQTARELLNTVIVKHPKLLKARLQLIELERRNTEYDRVEELYAQTFGTFTETRIRSCIAIRYARFLFKIQEDDDKALLILRKALKKDKGNIHLYHHVFDVCYQRRPIDNNGVLASVMLALASKELTLEEKYSFCIKRSEFLREHGTMAQLKEAKAEMEEIKRKLEKQNALIEAKKLEVQMKKEDGNAEGQEKANNGNESEDCKMVPPPHGSNSKANAIAPEGVDTKDPQLVNTTTNNHHPFSKNNAHISNGARNSPVMPLQQPPMPPLLDSVNGSKGEGKEERSEKRRKRDESSEGHRHKKRSSRSSSKKERKSKKSRRSEGRHKRGREEGEVKDDDEDVREGEEVYDASGALLYSSKEESKTEAITPETTLPPPHMPNLSMPQHGILPSEDKPYQAVPPSWDLDVPSMATYGYGASNELVKEGQNSLYERYYELIKQGYEAQERERSNQMVNSPGNVILEANNSYLPPPPMPQGILGESLFNQGKLENLHSVENNQGNLLSAPPLLPPPTTGLAPMFSTRLPPPQQQTNSPVENPTSLPPNLLGPPPGPVVGRLQSPLLNPALLQTKPPSLGGRGILDAPSKITRPELLPSLGSGGSHQTQMNLTQRNPTGLLGNYPGAKPVEREGRGGRGGRGGNRGRDRTRPQVSSFNLQQTTVNTSRPPPMAMNIPREITNDASFFNVPEWLIKDGGDLRLSDTSNGESVIRYWPRYLTDDGHKTLFQSLRTTVKWFQRKQLIGPPSENNWINLAKLVSWIGPCNYEKDGMVLTTNTSWPPEIVDLLHRLIYFSKSSFNSCFMSLYSSGHSHHPWHSESHEAMSKTPTTACISLGVTRTLEMKRADGSKYLRFPLFPGSLFVMEGATHTDWLCQIPKEPHVKGERISLSFRTMLMIRGVTV